MCCLPADLVLDNSGELSIEAATKPLVERVKRILAVMADGEACDKETGLRALSLFALQMSWPNAFRLSS
jgi:hypothetical protein